MSGRRSIGSYGYGMFSPTGYRASVQSGAGGSWVGGVRGAEMSSRSQHMPMATYHPIGGNPMPNGLTRPGAEWAGMRSGLANSMGISHASLRQTGRVIAALRGGGAGAAAGAATGVAAGAAGAAGAVQRPTLPGVDWEGINKPVQPAMKTEGGNPTMYADWMGPPERAEKPMEPMVLPDRLERFAASRVGRFAEGRVEKAVDRRFGHGTYSTETGRGTRRPAVTGPPPPF